MELPLTGVTAETREIGQESLSEVDYTPLGAWLLILSGWAKSNCGFKAKFGDLHFAKGLLW